MSDPFSHPADFQLAIECLAGDADSIDRLMKRHRPKMEAFLTRSGASPAEAEEIASETLTDCLYSGPVASPKLATYDGSCALQTWLNTVAVHRLFSFKRRQAFERRIMAPMPDDETQHDSRRNSWSGDLEDAEPSRDTLLSIMRSAIDSAFQKCAAQDFVLLQLAHCDRIKVAELAVMFRCDSGTISRRLERAEEGISRATLRHIKETDPWLELKWKDFVELCRTSTPASFGEE